MIKKVINLTLGYLLILFLAFICVFAYDRVNLWLTQESTTFEVKLLGTSDTNDDLSKNLESFESVDKTRNILANTTFILSCNRCPNFKPVILGKDELSILLQVKLIGDDAKLMVDQDELKKVIDSVIKKINNKEEINFDGKNYSGYKFFINGPDVQKKLAEQLLNLQGIQNNHKLIFLDNFLIENPITDGTLAPKYLEVDVPEQRLYQWENAQLLGIYVISTGRKGSETPRGLFKIKNRFENAFSPVANLWTPYWMAYTFDSKNGAWLGLHELPYGFREDGTKYWRPSDTMGKPVTGGCIQLNIGDAKKIFDWAEVGIPLLIHD